LCVSNDLFREASARDIRLTHVRVRVVGDFDGDPAVSQDVAYDVVVAGEASHEQLQALVSHVDAIAEIPNSLRRGTPVTLRHVEIAAS
jgi:putative redox protein